MRDENSVLNFTEKQTMAENLEERIENISKHFIPLMKLSRFNHSTVKTLKTVFSEMNVSLAVEEKIVLKVAFLRAGAADLFKKMQKSLQNDAVAIKLQEVMMDIHTLMMDFTSTPIEALHTNEETASGLEYVKEVKKPSVAEHVTSKTEEKKCIIQ